jgi:transposase-like protein
MPFIDPTRFKRRHHGFSAYHFTADEEEIRREFARIRWGSYTKQQCPDPECKAVASHYVVANRGQWRCRYCDKTFSVTSGTIFDKASITLRQLAAIFHYTIESAGLPSSVLSQVVAIEQKSAYLLMCKIRDAIIQAEDKTLLSGEVEIDAVYFCSYIRPANPFEARIDRRKAENQNPMQRAILVFRQRGAEGEGAVRTRVAMISTERDYPMETIVPEFVAPGSTIYTDSHPAYDVLGDADEPGLQASAGEPQKALGRGGAWRFFTLLKMCNCYIRPHFSTLAGAPRRLGRLAQIYPYRHRHAKKT